MIDIVVDPAPIPPIRLEVHKRLTDLLKTITPANGYTTDLAGNVYRGRLVFGAETPLPSVAILEVPIPLDQLPSPSGTPVHKGPWELMIQGWVEDDRENPTDPAHYLMADVKQALAKEQRKVDYDGGPENGILGLGRNVTAMYIGQGVVRPPEEVSAKAYFWLTLTLDLVENMEQPRDY